MEKALPRSAYVDPVVWEAERERLFARQWFCVAREEAVPASGDVLAVDVDDDPLTGARPVADDHPGQLALQLAVDRAPQRSGPQLRLVAALGEPVDRGVADLQHDLLSGQPLGGAGQHQPGDRAQLGRAERVEQHGVVDPARCASAVMPGFDED